MKQLLKVTGMGCADCATKIQNKLKAMAGVTAAKVNLETGRCEVIYDGVNTNPQAILLAIKSLGYGAEPA